LRAIGTLEGMPTFKMPRIVEPPEGIPTLKLPHPVEPTDGMPALSRLRTAGPFDEATPPAPPEDTPPFPVEFAGSSLFMQVKTSFVSRADDH